MCIMGNFRKVKRSCFKTLQYKISLFYILEK